MTPSDEPPDDNADAASPNTDAVRVTPIRDVEDKYVFRFEVGPAILYQLQEKLEALDPKPLAECLDAKYPGFYQLLHKRKPVYIGKTSRPLGTRLSEHCGKLSGRKGLRLTDMTCRFAYVEDPSLVDVAEASLIQFFGQLEQARWNTTGFGSKVTGYRRGRQEASEWARQFPPDLSVAIPAGSEEPLTLERLITQVAAGAPLTLSIPTALRPRFRKAHPQQLRHPPASKPFSEWVEVIQAALSPGWAVDRQPESWYIIPSDEA